MSQKVEKKEENLDSVEKMSHVEKKEDILDSVEKAGESPSSFLALVGSIIEKNEHKQI